MSISVEAISRRAGVGRSTAYRVLGDDPRVSPEAREKVLRSIRELGYPRIRPKGRRRRGLLLWIPGLGRSLASPHAREALAALEAALARQGRAVRIIAHPLPASPEDVPLEILREDLGGILTIAFYSNAHLDALARRWPVVGLFSSRQVPGVVSISPDYGGAARLAVEHLAGLGHRRIALVTGQVRERNFSRLFLEGYAGAMAHAGLELVPGLVHSDGGNVGEAEPRSAALPGEAAARELLARPGRPTALVARHDSLPGVIKALGALGLGVPADVSLVGCGGLGLPGEFRPRLTAACYSCADMVELALGFLGAVPRQGARLFVPVELQPGESVRRI